MSEYCGGVCRFYNFITLLRGLDILVRMCATSFVVLVLVFLCGALWLLAACFFFFMFCPIRCLIVVYNV